ncbi:hypothetical protein FACS1894182_15040 [Bacteroidia bacterium]|nr:hypothetical protein FACS1894182_15040 [Bacteroidia bacterium]
MSIEQMKLFLKILLFIVTMIIIIVGDVKSSTVITILREETLSSFIQKSQHSAILFENQNVNSCLNGENVLTYNEQITGKNGKIAKEGSVFKIGDEISEIKLANICLVGKSYVETVNLGKTIVIKTMLEVEIARFADDGILHVTKWIDEPVEVISKMGDEAITYSRNGAKATEELFLVKGKDGAEGIALGSKVAKGGSYLENLAIYKQLFKEGKYTELFTELKKTTAFPKMGKTSSECYRFRNRMDRKELPLFKKSSCNQF